jgi:hypothetical protein
MSVPEAVQVLDAAARNYQQRAGDRSLLQPRRQR